MNKKLIAGILCAGMVMSMTAVSFAEQSTGDQEQVQTVRKAERYEVLVIGDQDQSGESYIKELQQWLAKQGHFNEEPTGYFGEVTQRAVIEFQEKHEMTVDGKAGPITRAILMGGEYEAIPSSRSVVNAYGTGIGEYSTGDRGYEVTKIQTRLKELGYYNYEKITDFYGPITEEAVIAFKNANGLGSSSVVDVATYNALFSSSAQKRTTQATTTNTQTTAAATTATTTATTQAKTTGNTSKSSNSSSNNSGGSTPTEPTNGSGIEAMIAAAQAKTGAPYSYGASGPNSFDCSGFIIYCLNAAGKSGPRVADAQAANSAWQYVSYDQLKRGDLVFFTSPNSGSGVGHAGIYLGGGQFIHASSGSPAQVKVSTLSSGSYRTRFTNGRRVF